MVDEIVFVNSNYTLNKYKVFIAYDRIVCKHLNRMSFILQSFANLFLVSSCVISLIVIDRAVLIFAYVFIYSFIFYSFFNLILLQLLICVLGASPNTCNSQNGWSPLHYASKLNDHNTVE